MSFGSNVVQVAGLSLAGDEDRRDRFVVAMLDVALEQRQPFGGRREAVDAIAVVARRCGAALVGDATLTNP